MSNGISRNVTVLSNEGILEELAVPNSKTNRTLSLVDSTKDWRDLRSNVLKVLERSEEFAGVGAGATVTLSQKASKIVGARRLNPAADGAAFVPTVSLGTDGVTVTITEATTGGRVQITYVPKDNMETLSQIMRAMYPAR